MPSQCFQLCLLCFDDQQWVGNSNTENWKIDASVVFRVLHEYFLRQTIHLTFKLLSWKDSH